MKILFIADIVPDIHSGSAVRNYYLLKSLVKNHSIDFIGLTDDKNSVNVNIYKDLGIKNYVIEERKKLSFFAKLRCIITGKIPYIEQRRQILLPKQFLDVLSSYDAIHVAELNSYFFLEKYIKKGNTPVVLDAHNVEFTRFSSEINHSSFIARSIGILLSYTLKKLEIAAVKNVQHLCVCSAVDKKYFARYIPKENISIIPNGVNVSYFDLKKNNISIKNNIILFMGLLSYFPNDEGLHYYLSRIHPVVKKSFPHVAFHIIGKEAPAWLKEEAGKDTSITLLGFVDDTRPCITNATVCIAPLLSGSGTRLKILEYMAMRKPIVATFKAAEGIETTNQKNILLAKNADEFTQLMITAFQDKKLREELGKNARELVKTRYDWQSIGKEFNTMYNRILR